MNNRQLVLQLNLLALLLAGSAPGVSQTSRSSATRPPAGRGAESATSYSPVRMRSVEIIDSQGFGQRLVAASFLAPVEWNAQGVAAWPQRSQQIPCKPTPSLLFEAVSQDKLTGVQVLPGESWMWSPNPAFAQQLRMTQHSTRVVEHCEVSPVVSAADYLKAAIQKNKMPVEILSSAPVPESAQLTRHFEEINNQARRQMGPNAPYLSIDTARLHLRGNIGGAPTEGYLETAIVSTAQPTPMGPLVQVTVPFLVNKFVPAGQLAQSEKLLAAIANSVSINLSWQDRVDRFQAGLQKIQGNIDTDNVKTAGNIARIQRDANNYAYAKIRGVQRSSQNALHQSAQAFALSMNDTQEYRDPATGGTVLGSNRFNHVYSNGQGEYIYADSPSFNPNAEFRGSWQEMQPQKPQ